MGDFDAIEYLRAKIDEVDPATGSVWCVGRNLQRVIDYIEKQTSGISALEAQVAAHTHRLDQHMTSGDITMRRLARLEERVADIERRLIPSTL